MSEYYIDANGKIKKRKNKVTGRIDEKGKVVSIAPPVSKKKEEEEQSEKRTWFKKSEGGFWDTILGSAGDLGENISEGIVGLGEKLVDGAMAIAPSMYQYGAMGGSDGLMLNYDQQQSILNTKKTMEEESAEFIQKDLINEKKLIDDTLGKVNRNLGIDTEANSVFGAKSDSLAQSGGQLIGQIGLQAVGVPWYVTTGFSSLGGEMESALSQGASYNKALSSGMITAGADILTEKLFGGSGLGEKGLINLEPLTKGISNKVVKSLVDFGIDVTAEGSEEVVAGIMSNLGTALYKEESLKDIVASEEAIDEYIESFIGGAVLGGGANAVKLGSSIKNKTDYRTGVTANEQKILDKAVEQRIAEAEKDGTKLTKKEKAEIEQEVMNSLQRGEIDLETIEKEFGGESYSTLESLKKEAEEFKDLYNRKGNDKSRADEVRLAELEAKNTENSYENRIFEAQNQLTQEVQKATENDAYIREVYGEKAKKSEAFKVAPDEKYSEKEMEVVNKAVESGIINNTKKSHDLVKLLAKIHSDKGVNFDFANNEKLKNSGFAIDGKTIDGFKQGDNITINLESKKALNTIVGHEITHVLEGTDMYKALQDTVIEYAKTTGIYDAKYKDIVHLYKNQFQDNDLQKRKSLYDGEITAELVGEYIFSDTDFVRNLSTKNPNVFQKVFNEIKHMLKMATAGSDAERQLLKAKKIFEDVYRDTKRNTSDETQYALNSNFSKEVDAWYKDKEQFDKKGGFFQVGSTSEALKSIGVKEQEIIWDKSKIREVMEKHPEMTIDVIKTVPNAIENPVVVMQSNTALNSITIYGEVYANVQGKQQPVMVAMVLKPEGKKGRILDIQKISSAYVRADDNGNNATEKAQSLINNSEILYVDPNEKRTNDWLRALRLQLPAGLTKYGSISKVTYSSDFVNEDSESFGKSAMEDALKRAGLKTSDETNKPQYSISDNTSIEDKINSSMTMKEAKDMLQRVYNAVDIRGYRNADEWLQEMGSEDVAMTLESDYASYKKYIESNEDILNEEYTIADVLDAYMNGTLVGQQKESSIRLDTSKDTGFVDKRFYAPQDIRGGQDLYNIASQRVTNSNRSEVYKARADFIINAHNNGYIESLGLTRAEVNKKLKSWANYTPKAMDLSNSLNEGVATQNRWTGIENSTILNTISVTEEELGNLVKSIDGNSSEWQRQYITSTMLALDTHIDYKGLSFVFDGKGMSSDTALGEYVDSKQTIYIRRAGQNTVAHEMGHYLDHLWGRDLGYSGKDGLTGRGIKLENLNAEQRQFVKNFYNFLNDIENSSDIGSAYKQSANEVFARFVARFTEWTKNQATNNRYGYEDKWYKDNFTERQYREFVKLLQEKAMLDTNKTQYSLSDNKSIAPTPNGIYGDDVRLERSIAPPVAQTHEIAPQTHEIAPSVAPQTESESRVEPQVEDGEVAEENMQTRTRKEIQRALLQEGNVEFTKSLDNAKNIPMALMNNTDTIRVTEMVFGRENGKKINDLIFQKTIDNEAKSTRWQNQEREDIKNLGIKARSKMSEAVQKYGEGEYLNDKGEKIVYDDTSLAREFPDVGDQQRIKEASQVLRQKYDQYLELANKVLTDLGFDPIPKRKDYFRHFQELNDIFTRNGLPFNPQNMTEHVLPTDINGLTDTWSPQKNYFANAQQRKGIKTTLDAIGGIDGYISGISNLIFHTEDIQRGRAFEKLIRETYGQESGLENFDNMTPEEQQERIKKIHDNHLSNYASWVHEWTNNIAGKKSKVDRSIESLFGRKAFSVLDETRKQVGSNMIGFNVSSSLTNGIASIQAMAKTNKLAVLKGTADTVKNIFSKDGFVEKNDFLTNRMGTEMLSKKSWEKIRDAGFVFMKGMDWFTSNQIVRSKYHELRAKGLSEERAHAEAGQFASRIMADRTKGAMPQIYNSKMLGLVTQFQLEVNNQLYSMFYDTYHESKESAKNKALLTSAKMTFTLGQLMAYTHVFGKTFESLAGYNPTFDIIGIVATALGLGDDDEEKTTSERLKESADMLVDALPYVNILTGGGRVPVASGIPNLIGVATGGTDDYGNELTFKDEMSKLLYLLPPTGGNQIKKTTQGLAMFDKDNVVSGSYTDSGNLRFPVEDTLANRVQAGLFGQWANKNAREYFDRDIAPLRKKQIQEYKDLDLPISEYWDIRKGMVDKDKNEEKFDYIANLDLPIDKKNILINNAVKRKKEIDLTGYENYSSYEEFDFAVKNPGEYAMSKVVGGYDTYKKFTNALGNIEATKNANGQAINGSKKKKVLTYINNLNTDYHTKIMLYKKEYPSDDTYNMEIINYLNERDDITFKERVDILKELGFEVLTDGTIRW